MRMSARSFIRPNVAASMSEGQACSGTAISSLPGEPAHLALQVGQQVAVVHQQHVRLTAPGPGIRQVPHNARQRVRVLAGIVIAGDPSEQRVVQHLA